MKPIISSYAEPRELRPTANVSPQAGSSASQSACVAAVRDERDRIAQRLNDDVIRAMFGVGLRLQATAHLAAGSVQARIELAVRDLDLIITEVRGVIFDRNPGLHMRSGESTPDSVPDVSQLPAEFAFGAESAGSAIHEVARRMWSANAHPSNSSVAPSITVASYQNRSFTQM